MKTLVSFLCVGIISLSFLHDHRVNWGDIEQGSRATETAPVLRHVHLGEHAAHEPVSKPEPHEHNVQWVFVDHVGLTALTSSPSADLLSGLSRGDNRTIDDITTIIPQQSWQPASPVRGSPTPVFYAVLSSFHYSFLPSGRAPPLSFL
jgi:hypothetical protein